MMIVVDLGTLDYYDDDKGQFIYEQGGRVRFEYSLKVVFDWEARWKKPFLKPDTDIKEHEMIDFYKLMALDPFDDRFISDELMRILANYISDPQTATTFNSFQEGGGRNSIKGKTFTAEELYALMIMASVPLEFENRNLNRLFTILRIISNKNSPPKKMAKADILKQNAELNAMRKKQMNTKG